MFINVIHQLRISLYYTS